MEKKILLLITVITFSVFSYAKDKTNDIKVTDLKCEYESNPIGIDTKMPQLSWKIESLKRGFSQKAYQIIAATTKENLDANKGDLWDSGKTNSSESTCIPYQGIELGTRQKCYWKIRVWDANDIVSNWSEQGYFEMGLLNEKDWFAGWVGYAVGMPGRVIYFKGTFVPQKPIKEARAYVAGLGFYEMYINKKKVGDHVLDPAQSTYSKRVYYATYDVTTYLAEVNSIVIPVAQGWMGTPKLRIQMHINYEDGTQDVVTTNQMRAISTGPTVYSTVFDGELYDARLENEDLYKPGEPPGLMNKQWGLAYNTDEPVGKMVSQRIEPIKIVDSITPTVITEPSPGVYVIDAGRNLAGWASISVSGKEGTEIKMKFAETLYENGFVNQDNLRNAKCEDNYILKGKGIETWEPAFTYHGFRYVQVEGFPKRPEVGDIKIKIVRSAVPQSGTFNCSNQLLNDIHQMVVNTEAANLHSVPTDCPQRDERMGWLNDLTVRIEQAIYNFNFSRFYPKYMKDIADTQDDDGTITCVAPFRFGARPADPVSASYLLLAKKCYEFYGNKRMIEEHFEGMKAWVDYLYSRTEKGIVNYSYYGDWCPPRAFLMDPNGSGVSRDTPGKLISTGYLYHSAKLLSEMAGIIGKKDIVTQYNTMVEEIYNAFNREYWNEQIGGYGSNNQACNSFALYLGLADSQKKPRVLHNLVEDVKKHDYHLTTGNLCTKYLLEVLTENGHHEAAYKIATQTTYPGWGFMLANGATTLWERWEYLTGDAMNSHNHPMMGSVGTWFYKYVLGITPDSVSPAFEQFNLHPVIFDDLSFAEGELITEKGVIKSAWRKEGKSIIYTINIPENTLATVYVPTTNVKSVKEGGKSTNKIKSIEFIGEESEYAVYRISSGSYQFKSEWNK